MGTRGGETKDTERHSLTLLPPPERCVCHPPTVHHPTGRGGGRSGGLKGHGDRIGQEASRVAPVLGAMAGQGTRAAMAERGARAAMAGQGTREAMADRGAWVAMVDPGTQEAMAEQGAWEAMADREDWEAMVDRGACVAMVDPGTQEAMADHGARAAMAGQGAWEAMADWVAFGGLHGG